MTVYFNGDFLPIEKAHLSPNDRGFLFSDGVYEVLCAYEGRLFLAAEHFARLKRSLEALRIDFDVTDERFSDIIHALLRKNGLEDQNAKVYLQITRGAPPARQHAFPSEPTAPTVYATATPYELPQEQWAQGIKGLLCPDERWGRCDIKSISLLPNVLANQRAHEAGAYEAILVRVGASQEDIVTEGSHSSFAAVFDGTVVTHPLGPTLLPGVTRGLVLKLAREEGIPLREEPFTARRLPDADELFLMGTTTGVMPVVEVEREEQLPGGAASWTVGDGAPGPITRQLQEAFREATRAQHTPTLGPTAFLEAPA